MSLFAVVTTNTSDLRNPNLWVTSALSGSRPTTSGENVGPDTPLAIPAYFAAMRAISEDIAKLPLITYKRLATGKSRAEDHPLATLLRTQPNPMMGAQAFRETLTGSALTWGNGYAQIVRNDLGRIDSLWIIHPGRVLVRRRPNNVDVFYEVRGPTGKVGELEPNEIIHIHGIGPDGISGFSVAQIGAESHGISLASQKFAGSFYGNGANMSGVFQHPARLKEEARKRIVDSIAENFGGGAENANKFMVLWEGLQFTPLSIPPEQAQFLESRQFSVEEIARWFRIPPHKIQHLTRATFNNIEQQGLDYHIDTLGPWIGRWEEEIKRKLFGVDDKVFFAEHLIDALLRADSKARGAFYKAQLQNGSMSQNEIRERENLNGIGPEGDTFYIPSNLTRAQDSSKGIVASGRGPGGRNAKGSQAGPPKEPGEGNGNAEADFRAVFFPLALDAAWRSLRREVKASSRASSRLEGDSEKFMSWMGKFYHEHRETVLTDNLCPVLSAAMMSLGLSGCNLEQHFVSHCTMSMAHLARLHAEGRMADFESWAKVRANDLAEALIKEIFDAAN